MQCCHSVLRSETREFPSSRIFTVWIQSRKLRLLIDWIIRSSQPGTDIVKVLEAAMFRSRAVYFFTLVLLVAADGPGCHVLATLDFTLGTLESPFQCNAQGNLWCEGNASESSGETLHLTPDQRTQSFEFYYNTKGMALFSLPVHMVDARGRWLSFSTHFRFEIESLIENFRGDGLAFVMLNRQVPGFSGGSLGIYDQAGCQLVQTLAIEFDTFHNQEFEDMNNNHVGVDLQRAISKVSRDAHEADIDLAGGRTIDAWIDYHAISEVLEVRIALHDTKPKESFLTYPLALGDVFPESGKVYVGFSGSNGFCNCHNFYSIHDWKFRAFSEISKILHLVEIIGGFFIVIVIIIVLICKLVSREQPYTSVPVDDDEPCRRYSIEELVAATKNFDSSQKLGEGRFGSVYRGFVSRRSEACAGGSEVAVKKLRGSQEKHIFHRELKVIKKVQHKHIVRLLGWCEANEGVVMLVYELMPNGSLDKALFTPNADLVLSWTQRYTILLDVASALLYLHEEYEPPVIHRDIKSGNIMLDKDYRGKLGDFGLARLVNHNKDLKTTMPFGTFGYQAPKTLEGEFTDKSDVFAFGKVMLEIASGNRSSNCHWNGDNTSNWVKSDIEVRNFVDSRLGRNYDKTEAAVVIQLGLLCCDDEDIRRPTMRAIMSCLKTRKLTSLSADGSPTRKPAQYASSTSKPLLNK
ncbi:hypothetical protein MPTK1_5g05705 [Marchantia polymorpha subsp. ruderalis]